MESFDMLHTIKEIPKESLKQL